MRKCLQELSTSQELREKDVKGDLHRHTGNYRIDCNMSHEQGKSQVLEGSRERQLEAWVGIPTEGPREPLQREGGPGGGDRMRKQQKGGPLPGTARGEFLGKGTPRRAGGKRPTHHLGNLRKGGPEHLEIWIPTGRHW